MSGFAGRALTAGTTSSAIMAIAMAIISGIIILFFVLVVAVAVFVLPVILLLSIPKEQPHIVGQVDKF